MESNENATKDHELEYLREMVRSQNIVIEKQRERMVKMEKEIVMTRGLGISGKITVFTVILQSSVATQKTLQAIHDQGSGPSVGEDLDKINALIAKTTTDLMTARQEWNTYLQNNPEIASFLSQKCSGQNPAEA
ncbi:MAG: hypothetical protein GYA23_01915 [Methanomicrobiales archaeon]|nr:hypothetical protein [Methanomicrobiales archaeon]